MTIKEIAKLAGVSVGSVSTVFSTRATNVHLSQETRERILSVARQYDYSPSIMARGMRSRKSYLLGFFYRPDNHYLFNGLLKGIRKTCSLHDHDIIVYPSADLQEEAANLQTSHVKELDGIITTPIQKEGQTNAVLYKALASSGIPLIQLFNQYWKEFPVIMRDYEKIGADSVQELYNRGHRRIGILIFDNYTDPVDGINNWTLMQGLQKRASELGVSLEIFPISAAPFPHLREGYIKSAFAVAEELVSDKDMPTALIAASSNLAYGIYGGLMQHHISVPQDIALLACGDDTEPFWQLTPSLAHYPIAFETMGEKCAEYCLMSEADREKWPPRQLISQPLYQGMTI